MQLSHSASGNLCAGYRAAMCLLTDLDVLGDSAVAFEQHVESTASARFVEPAMADGDADQVAACRTGRDRGHPGSEAPMNLFAVLGLPDVHDLARRVLVGDVGSARTAARSAVEAGGRVDAQADAMIRERDQLLAGWSGAEAEQVGRTLTVHESVLRAQARQLTAGAAAFDDAGDALGRAQDAARQIEGAATAMQGAFELGVGASPGAASVEFLAPFRANAMVLATEMTVVVRGYQASLNAIAVELAAEWSAAE